MAIGVECRTDDVGVGPQPGSVHRRGQQRRELHRVFVAIALKQLDDRFGQHSHRTDRPETSVFLGREFPGRNLAVQHGCRQSHDDFGRRGSKSDRFEHVHHEGHTEHGSFGGPTRRRGGEHVRDRWLDTFEIQTEFGCGGVELLEHESADRIDRSRVGEIGECSGRQVVDGMNDRRLHDQTVDEM